MNKKHVVSFLEGMDKDTDLHKYPNTRYAHAENFRFVYDEANSMGILSNNVGGSSKIVINLDSALRAKIVGWTMLRNDLILFLYTGNNNFLGILQFTEEDLEQDINITSWSHVERYLKIHKFRGDKARSVEVKDDKVIAIGRYESSNVQKIYWIDGVSLKFANLADPNVGDYDVSVFESFPKFSSGQISTELISGSLRAGRVQYAYQLFNVNGASSVVSALSEIRSVTSSIGTTNATFRGNDSGENTNKGFRVTIDNVDRFYDRIRLFRIHYGDENLDPTAYLINEREIGTSTQVFTDSTEIGMGQVDLAEVIATKVELQAKTMETKNNILFQGNVTENVFEVDYDASTNDNVRVTPVISPRDIGRVEYVYHRARVNLELQPGFQRDEIYRFGIVLFDEKLRASFVKPIGDFKVPDDDNIVSVSGSMMKARYRYYRFIVRNLPESVKAFQIVRVPRDSNKRSVIDTGLACRIMSPEPPPSPTPPSFFSEPIPPTLSISVYPKLLEYTSPEYLYNDIREVGTNIEIWQDIRDNNIIVTDSFSNHESRAIKVTNYANRERSINPITSTDFYRYVDDPDFPVNAGGIVLNNRVYFRRSGGFRRGIKGSCIIVNTADNIPTSAVNPGNFYYARRRKNLDGTIGRNVRTNTNFYGPIESSVFIPCSDIVQKTSSSHTVIARGDTYINYFEIQRVMKSLSNSTYSRLMSNISLPVETTIDLNYKTNPTLVSIIAESENNKPDNLDLIQETKNLQIRGDREYAQDFDLYQYNNTYSRLSDIKSYVVRPETLRTDTNIDTRVYHSERKINAELEDGWLVFRQFLDVDTTYGGITKLHSFKNNLYFFQPKGIGILSVDQRELTNTDSISALTLGVGGILDRYDYITTESGSNLYESIVSSRVGIYYIDSVHKTLNRLGEIPESISDNHGMKSYVSKANLTNGKAIYNPEYNAILFFIDGKALEYNESLQKFTSFYTFNPDYVINYNDKVLYSKNNIIYTLDDITVRGRFTDSIEPSKITFVLNPEGRFINRLDVLEMLTYVNEGVTPRQHELYETFTRFRITNTYQDTGWIDIDDEVAVRRMRNWRINHLRDKTDEGRLKDSYFILELEFSNTANKLIKLNDLVVTHFPVRPY